MNVAIDFRSEEHGGVGALTPGASARAQFPLFSKPHSTPLAYLDTAASAQKPKTVIDRLTQYLSYEHANIHRGAYALSAVATENYEASRRAVARFIGAADPDEVIFTRGATESFNLVAYGMTRLLKAGDTILLTILEHHSNIVPWQLLAERVGAQVVFADIHPNGELNRADFSQKLRTLKPRLVSFTAHSNALGTVNPVAELVAEAKAVGAWVMVDAAQAVVHGGVSVADWGCDFLAVSGHKMYGPTGIGFLYGRKEYLEQMTPFLGGGDMIEQVTTTGSTFAPVPRKFEAGTPAIAEAIALQSAVEFMEKLGSAAIQSHEAELLQLGLSLLQSEPGVTVFGPVTTGGAQSAILSFTVDGVHPHDFASIADGCNVQVRAGHHCTQPLWRRLGIQSTIRASLGVYSIAEDLHQLIAAIREARRIFR